MDVLEKIYLSEFNDKLLLIFNLIKFSSRVLEVKGSGALKSQKYVGDYDLFTLINDVSARAAYDEFYRILNEIQHHNDCYFIELKMQSISKRKFRFYPK